MGRLRKAAFLIGLYVAFLLPFAGLAVAAHVTFYEALT